VTWARFFCTTAHFLKAFFFTTTSVFLHMWVKLDDHFPDHPKIVAAGPMAAFLYVAGLCYANRLLTDGFIPKNQVTRLLPENGHKNGTDLAAKLCTVGLWLPVKGEVEGFQVHDFLKYQPSKRKVLKERKQTAKRQQQWRGKKTKKKTAP